MNGYRPMPAKAHASDAELMRRVADGSEESLGLLHRRFARLIFGLASQTLDRAAADELPPPKRAAIRLAFLDDLTHEQVAAELGLPLGTAKTRIRAGLQKLRGRLGPRSAALAALCLLVALGVRYRSEHAALERYDRALSMVTASDSANLRLGPVSGTPEEAHARYRGRPGVDPMTRWAVGILRPAIAG